MCAIVVLILDINKHDHEFIQLKKPQQQQQQNNNNKTYKTKPCIQNSS